MSDKIQYGTGDATFMAIGGVEAIRLLVDTFYELMESEQAFKTIWQWHPADRQQSRDKLALFLCGWMGGPKLFQQKYGSISLPKVHRHLPVTENEMNQWLNCMEMALVKLNHPRELREYLMRELSVPAERIHQVSSDHHAKD